MSGGKEHACRVLSKDRTDAYYKEAMKKMDEFLASQSGQPDKPKNEEPPFLQAFTKAMMRAAREDKNDKLGLDEIATGAVTAKVFFENDGWLMIYEEGFDEILWMRWDAENNKWQAAYNYERVK